MVQGVDNSVEITPFANSCPGPGGYRPCSLFRNYDIYGTFCLRNDVFGLDQTILSPAGAEA
jgi:hypothetical protein